MTLYLNLAMTVQSAHDSLVVAKWGNKKIIWKAYMLHFIQFIINICPAT